MKNGRTAGFNDYLPPNCGYLQYRQGFAKTIKNSENEMKILNRSEKKM
jgi:hypothetical protein